MSAAAKHIKVVYRKRDRCPYCGNAERLRIKKTITDAGRIRQFVYCPSCRLYHWRVLSE